MPHKTEHPRYLLRVTGPCIRLTISTNGKVRVLPPLVYTGLTGTLSHLAYIYEYCSVHFSMPNSCLVLWRNMCFLFHIYSHSPLIYSIFACRIHGIIRILIITFVPVSCLLLPVSVWTCFIFLIMHLLRKYIDNCFLCLHMIVFSL